LPNFKKRISGSDFNPNDQMIFDESEPSHSHRASSKPTIDQTTMTDEKLVSEKPTMTVEPLKPLMEKLLMVNRAIQASKIFLHIGTQVEFGDVDDDIETASNYSRASRRGIKASRYHLDPS